MLTSKHLTRDDKGTFHRMLYSYEKTLISQKKKLLQTHLVCKFMQAT